MPDHPLAADLDRVLEHGRAAWEDLRGARLFITGGTGFFGCWLLESFAWANDRLKLNASAVILTRNPEAFRKKAPHLAARADWQFTTGDVRDFAFPAGPFSHVIHAATEASDKLNKENPGLMLDTIVAGTRRVLEFAGRAKARKFLLTSSGAVYGAQPAEMTHVPEDYPGAPDVSSPRSAYGEGKRLSELLCAIEGPKLGLETKIARCFAFAGPHLPLDTHFAIGNFIRDAMAGQPIAIQGDGTPFRSYLYAGDLAAWLWVILAKGVANRPYNVGSNQSIGIAETAHAVARALGGKSVVSIAQKPLPGQPARRYVPDVSRAVRELGLDQWTPLEDAIRSTAAWHSLSNK